MGRLQWQVSQKKIAINATKYDDRDLNEHSRSASFVNCAEIKEETGCQIIELWVLDLSSFASVIAFYERFERDGGRLDILVENAAVIPNPKDAPTTDGWAPGCVAASK